MVEGLDDRGGRMIARKSARGLAHYRTLRADLCLPAKEGWGTLGAPADGLSARQWTASPRHVAGRGVRFQEAVKGSQGRDEGKDK